MAFLYDLRLKDGLGRSNCDTFFHGVAFLSVNMIISETQISAYAAFEEDRTWVLYVQGEILPAT